MKHAPENELPADAPLRIGEVIGGKYRVERLIGRGGMGFVVAATHLQLGEKVAIKLLLPGASARPGAVERFLREGRATAKIKSEHVARVHDSGSLDHGEPYLVLELLEGRDLRSIVDERGPLSVEHAVTYALQACEALAEAHALGIVHRDIKPGNLFLTRRRDGSLAIKIIDFGLSKTAEVAGSEVTGSDAAFGTAHYMAPEQMRSARDVDPRADVWSLGALIFGLVAGAPPFPGETMVEVYDRMLKGPPSLRKARPEVPEQLDVIVRRCLRFDPLDRYDDVGELARALAEVAPEEARISAARASRIARGESMEDTLDLHGAANSIDSVRTVTEGSEEPRRSSEATESSRDPTWSRERGASTPLAPAVARPMARPRRVAWGLVAAGAVVGLGAIGLVRSRSTPVADGAQSVASAPRSGAAASAPASSATEGVADLVKTAGTGTAASASGSASASPPALAGSAVVSPPPSAAPSAPVRAAPRAAPRIAPATASARPAVEPPKPRPVDPTETPD